LTRILRDSSAIREGLSRIIPSQMGNQVSWNGCCSVSDAPQ
jgi:hypothetical protein